MRRRWEIQAGGMWFSGFAELPHLPTCISTWVGGQDVGWAANGREVRLSPTSSFHRLCDLEQVT